MFLSVGFDIRSLNLNCVGVEFRVWFVEMNTVGGVYRKSVTMDCLIPLWAQSQTTG
jgi:hypothetical protein